MLTLPITRPAAETGLQLAKDEATSLEIKDGSVFKELIDTTYSPLLESNWTLEQLAQILTDTNRVNGPHMDVQTGIVNDAVKSVSSVIGYIRNDVIGVITRYHEEVMTNFSQIRLDDPADKYKVTMISLPSPLIRGTEELGLNEFKNVSSPVRFTTVNGSFNIDRGDALHKLLSTGNEALDNSILSWVLTLDDDLVERVWSLLFNKTVSELHLKSYFSNRMTVNAMDDALLMYLLAKGMKKGNLDFTGTLPSNEGSFIDDLLQYTAVKTLNSYNAYRREIKRNNLVMERDKDHFEIKVIKELYTKYVSKGGSAASLLGSLVSDSNMSSLPSMVDKVFDHNRSWKSYSKMSKVSNDRQELTFFKQIAKTVFVRQFEDEMTDLEKEHYGSDSTSDGPIQKAKELIDRLDYGSVADAHGTCRQIITLSRFYFTPAEEFLRNMDSVKLSNPDISANEAALIATVEYVAEYLVAQMYK